MKQLYICENHHHVLLPWARIKRVNKELNLLTFDHHTDTHDAFLDYLYYHKEESLENLISKLDYKNDLSILNAIKKLKNDEHIDTAIKCNIFNKAFVISYDGSFDKPSSNEFNEIFSNVYTKAQYLLGEISLPKIQTYPDAAIFTIGTSGCLDNDNCLSDDFISHMLEKIRIMSNIDVIETKYVLDVDLDYFHSYESLKQDNLDLFKNLISQSAAITIATEPIYAREGILPDRVLQKMLNLAREACDAKLEIIDLRDMMKSRNCSEQIGVEPRRS